MGRAKIQRLAIQVLGGLLALGSSQAGLTAQAQEHRIIQGLVPTSGSVASTFTVLESREQALNLNPELDSTDHQTDAAETLILPAQEEILEESGAESSDAIEATEAIEATTRLVLSLSERRVRLYRDDREIVSYPVAVGKPGWETPTGQFKIYQKVVNPTWRHPWNGSLVEPGPHNPLGYRWVGFLDRGSEAFGFHGTTNESLIGQAVSHGCVRMKNADVEALFEQIEVGTDVIVKP